MASEVEICNLALLKFGDKQIVSLNDTTKEGRACKVFYPLMRDAMLYGYAWNFAMKRADISAQVAPTPAFGWDYAYTLPADCLRVWELVDSDAEWEIESGQFLTDQEEEIYIRFIRQVTEPGRFNPAFVNCLATRLAAELAAKLMGDGGKAIRLALLEELEKLWLPEARFLNAIEGNRPKRKGEKQLSESDFSWQTEGR